MIDVLKIKASFSAVRHDMASLKENVIEWTSALVGNQKKMLEKVRELERRVERLEKNR